MSTSWSLHIQSELSPEEVCRLILEGLGSQSPVVSRLNSLTADVSYYGGDGPEYGPHVRAANEGICKLTYDLYGTRTNYVVMFYDHKAVSIEEQEYEIVKGVSALLKVTSGDANLTKDGTIMFVRRGGELAISSDFEDWTPKSLDMLPQPFVRKSCKDLRLHPPEFYVVTTE